MQKMGVLEKGYTFFDAFSGTGSVSKTVSPYYSKIIVNDNLISSAWYSKSNILGNKFNWGRLGFDPVDYFNASNKHLEGFIYHNYSPSSSTRMYFTENNAKKIDYIRTEINNWFSQQKINVDEYQYLVSCLIEAVSKVANVAGVYGAYLKRWDPRAHKELSLEHFEKNNSDIKVCSYVNFIEDIIDKVECDVLYLDPPYTQNQYGTQYHLLETIAKYDSPTISKVTGSRPTGPMRSDWSYDLKSHILLDSVLAKTKAKHVFLSYSSGGLMSKDFIMANMKRYSLNGNVIVKKIPYKQYNNWKNNPRENHEEYIFYIEMKDKVSVRYQSPLNYTGNKFSIIEQISKNIPRQEAITFVDAFGGGFNVGININAKKVVFNDINKFVVDLIKSFRDIDTFEYLKYVRKIEKKYDLSKGKVQNYYLLRDDYNSTPVNNRDPRILFVLVMYGFNQQMRFNADHDFNNPAGIRWFNDKMLEKFISFSRRIKSMDIDFFSRDYIEFIENVRYEDALYYFDPPYLLTVGSYNDGKRGFKGWTEGHQKQLFNVLGDSLRNEKWVLSYVANHRGKDNKSFIDWVEEEKFEVLEINNVRGHGGSLRDEVLVRNFGKQYS